MNEEQIWISILIWFSFGLVNNFIALSVIINSIDKNYKDFHFVPLFINFYFKSGVLSLIFQLSNLMNFIPLFFIL